jgi:two-component system, LytTR family, sensor kinase
MNFLNFTGKKLYITLHALAWTILFFLPSYLLFISSGDDRFFYIRFYSNALAYALIFYINYFWLLPKFFFARKKGWYFLSVVVLIVGIFFVLELSDNTLFSKENKKFNEEINKIVKENDIPRPPQNWHIYNYLFTSFLISGFSMGLKFSDKYRQNEKERKEAEKEKLNSELTLLKNQVSPHFFFNTLNNIYSLVEINTGDAQKAILQLSKMMRYMLYESENGNTLLSREIDFMKNYIELMKLRLSSRVPLSVTFPDKYNDVSISPLLFISFVENAFKHGISYREKSFIEITMTVAESVIHFHCRNSIHKEETTDTASGIGLENVRKRLLLLYPSNHTLSILTEGEIYDVQLKINTNVNQGI